jgi:hypothetical protein
MEQGVRYLQEAISINEDAGFPFILHRAQRDMAEVELDDALVRARSMPHPYAEAKLQYTYGRLEAARGNTSAALERFTSADFICARLGERLYAERIERETAALGG